MSNSNYLKNITSPKDVKKLNKNELASLAQEIRQVLVETVTRNGGHLASNLGVVELSIALHRVFNSPYDHIIWDVGHQSYTHKLLTGRYDKFDTLRTKDGLSGFSRPCESEHDFFFSGHSGTAVSAALGIAEAKAIKKDNSYVVAVVGDGSFTGGLVYEALNNAGRTNSRLIVILNDNEMSISKNVGAMARYMTTIRTKPRYYKFKAKTESFLNRIPLIGRHIASVIFKLKSFLKSAIYKSTWFEELGFRYIGPIDGHDIEHLTQALNSAKIVNHPVILHINTTKGKGYDLAEQSPIQFHGVPKFDLNSGDPIPSGKNYSAQFGEFMCEVAEKDRRICAITAAMSVATGLEDFKLKFGNRFFDVGIAESHAVTFASGLAKFNMLPVFAVYSSFLQRSYDQLVHDAALQKQKIVLAIDRAGFVGEDGETHQGLFDVAFMNGIPDIIVYAPSSYAELKRYMNNALYHDKYVVAVRYPRGEANCLPDDFEPSFGAFDLYGDETADKVIVTYGRVFSAACAALKILAENGVRVKVLKLNRIKPVDCKALDAVAGAEQIFFFEEGVRSAGTGEKFALMLLESGYKGDYTLTAVEDCFVLQGTVKDQLEKYRLDTAGIVKTILGSACDESEKET